MPFQVARPTTDTTNTTTGSSAWADISPGVGSLFSQINDLVTQTPVTGIFVNIPASSPGSVYVSKLSTLETPETDKLHFLRYAFRIDPALAGTTHDTDFIIELRKGYVNEGAPGTVIHSDTWNAKAGGNAIAGSTFIYEVIALTETEAAAITDYNDLWLRIVGKNITEANRCDLYYFYMTVPSVDQTTSNIKRTAKAPIWYAEVQTCGTLNGEPVFQMRNDGTKKAIIREFYVIGGNGDGGSTSLCRGDVLTLLYTSLPSGVGPGGTRVTANVVRLDDDGPAASPGLVVSGIDFSDWQQTGWDFCSVRQVKFLEFRPANSQLQSPLPVPIRNQGAFPIGIMPGDAIEMRWAFNGSGFCVRGIVVWEEVPTRA